jgi:hypothetical protein
MPFTRRRVVCAATLLAGSLASAAVHAATWEERSTPARVGWTSLAAVANVVPIVSAVFAPKCLPGYIVCKITFAGMSLIAAADQLLFAGNGDTAQTKAILYRGFGGDWFLTGRHVNGDATPQPLPDPPPPTSAGDGGGAWEPPPR